VYAWAAGWDGLSKAPSLFEQTFVQNLHVYQIQHIIPANIGFSNSFSALLTSEKRVVTVFLSF